MAYCGYVTTLKNVRKHPNADRLLLAECFGNTVSVNLDYFEGQKGVYFPTDGQLSVEFCEHNNLVRKKNEAGENIGGYMDPDKRNVKTIKLRGEMSDGLFLPMTCLDFCFEDGNADAHLSIGDTIDVVNGHEICKKYIPRRNPSKSHGNGGNKTRKRKENIAPLFMEHADTAQPAYNLGAFKPGDEVEITLKMHGTSQRTGHLPVITDYCGPNIAFDIILRKNIFKLFKPTKKMIEWAESKLTPLYNWGYVSGTRRVVLDTYDGGFYGSNHFREQHHNAFVGKLWKGETVYYEVVGFMDTGAPIMAECNNDRVNDKAFKKKWGKTTIFSYGCNPNGCTDGELMKFATAADGTKLMAFTQKPQSDIYVYRMTMTNEDGEVVEYTPDFMRYRCEQMGVKTVPVFARFIIPEFYQLPDNAGSLQAIDAGEYVRKIAEDFYAGADPVGKTHIREGVVARIINRPKFTAFKHKNEEFKIIEGIIKDIAEVPDIEEAQEDLNE